MSDAPKYELSYGPRAIVARSPNFQTREETYPFSQMGEPRVDPKTGETIYAQFFVEGKTTKRFSGVAQAASKRLLKKGVKATFSVSTAEDEGVAGVLVQRREYREPKVLTPAELAARAAKRAANKAKKAA